MRKILCIVLAFAICSFCVFPYVHAEDTATDLQTQREELQNQLNDANEQLDGVQSELSENLQQVQKLDEKISTSQQELDELNTKIADLQTSMDEVEAKLKEAEENYKKQKELLDNRLIAVYESSDTQYLDVILRPDGKILLLDEDELKSALEESKITKEDFDLAYFEANKLMKLLDGKENKLKDFTDKFLNYFLSLENL